MGTVFPRFFDVLAFVNNKLMKPKRPDTLKEGAFLLMIRQAELEREIPLEILSRWTYFTKLFCLFWVIAVDKKYSIVQHLRVTLNYNSLAPFMLHS